MCFTRRKSSGLSCALSSCFQHPIRLKKEKYHLTSVLRPIIGVKRRMDFLGEKIFIVCLVNKIFCIIKITLEYIRKNFFLAVGIENKILYNLYFNRTSSDETDTPSQPTYSNMKSKYMLIWC